MCITDLGIGIERGFNLVGAAFSFKILIRSQKLWGTMPPSQLEIGGRGCKLTPLQGLTEGGGGPGGPNPPLFDQAFLNAVHCLNGFPSFYNILTLDPPSKIFLDLPLPSPHLCVRGLVGMYEITSVYFCCCFLSRSIIIYACLWLLTEFLDPVHCGYFKSGL